MDTGAACASACRISTASGAGFGGFARSLLDEAATLFHNGEPEAARILLRDLVCHSEMRLLPS